MQLRKIRHIASITVREGIRNRALQGILFIASLLCVVYLITIPMFAFDTGKVAVELTSASITLAGLAIVIFLGIALIAKDIHQRSVCMILSRPVPRSAYILGKFCGVGVTVLIAVLVIGVMGLISAAIGVKFIVEMEMPRNFSWVVLTATIIYQYLALLIMTATAFFFAVSTSNEYLSMLFTFCVYIIGNSLETIVKILQAGEFFKSGAGYLNVMKILTWIFPNFSAFNLRSYLGYGIALPWPDLMWIGLYGVFYIAILLTFTTIIFNHKELS